MGLESGFTDDQGQTALALYTAFSQPDPQDDAWVWPDRLLPICHRGCGIYSCVDRTAENGPIVIWDPNLLDDGMAPSNVIRRTGRDLASWLGVWVTGQDLWGEMVVGDAPDS